jgi:hypothetical protein
MQRALRERLKSLSVSVYNDANYWRKLRVTKEEEVEPHLVTIQHPNKKLQAISITKAHAKGWHNGEIQPQKVYRSVSATPDQALEHLFKANCSQVLYFLSKQEDKTPACKAFAYLLRGRADIYYPFVDVVLVGDITTIDISDLESSFQDAIKSALEPADNRKKPEGIRFCELPLDLFVTELKTVLAVEDFNLNDFYGTVVKLTGVV